MSNEPRILKKTGPKPRSLFDRVGARLARPLDVEAELASYPDPKGLDRPCWKWQGATTKPRWHVCKPTPVLREGPATKGVVRALFESLAGEPIPETLRAYSLCRQHLCVSPFHHALKGYALNRYSVADPMPARLAGAAFCVPADFEEDVEAVIYNIMRDEKGSRKTAEEFRAEMAAAGLEYSAEVIAEAYQRIERGQV